MKLLLDENLPVDLRHFLPGHEPFTVTFMGWKGLKNGALLARAAADKFEAFITKDTNLPYQQSPAALPVAVVVLLAGSNALDDIKPLVPALLRALQNLRKGAQSLAEAMQGGMGDGMGEPLGDVPDSAERTDPLGRPLRSREYGDDFTVKVPGEIDVQRARRVLEELRRRLGDPGRPRLELDYLERLLRDY